MEAFPWDTAPKYLLRDRDCIYGSQFQTRVQSRGIVEVLSAPRSPWQHAFVERVIGSLRRDCLDHVVVLNDRHLKRILTSTFNYYHHWRTHLSLAMDSPESRSVQSADLGKIVQLPEVDGLHHHYERLAS
jgi:transposase InsO family protein